MTDEKSKTRTSGHDAPDVKHAHSKVHDHQSAAMMNATHAHNIDYVHHERGAGNGSGGYSKSELKERASKTKLSKTRAEKNRLTAIIKDLRQRVNELEEQNIELSKLEGKYRQRSQDLKERVAEEQQQKDQLKTEMNRLESDSKAIHAHSQSEKNHQSTNMQQLQLENKQQNDQLNQQKEKIIHLESKLKHQHTILNNQSNILNNQLPIILSDIENVKLEMKGYYENIIAVQREKYEIEITNYKIEITKINAIKKGVAIGRKKQFDSQLLAEKMEMKRLRLEEKQLNEERLRANSVNIGATVMQETFGETNTNSNRTTGFDRPDSILRTLVHRLPTSIPKLPKRVKEQIPKISMVNFQLAMARLRSFDELGVTSHVFEDVEQSVEQSGGNVADRNGDEYRIDIDQKKEINNTFSSKKDVLQKAKGHHNVYVQHERGAGNGSTHDAPDVKHAHSKVDDHQSTALMNATHAYHTDDVHDTSMTEDDIENSQQGGWC
jgi:chromosome segregation ATPase